MQKRNKVKKMALGTLAVVGLAILPVAAGAAFIDSSSDTQPQTRPEQTRPESPRPERLRGDGPPPCYDNNDYRGQRPCKWNKHDRHRGERGFYGHGHGFHGGFTGPSASTVTVAEALKMSDDQYVALRGNIIRQVGKESYLFKDETGEVKLKIHGHVWRGQLISPEDKIEIRGEIDLDKSKITVDVDTLIKQ